jgi:hypothetical protein
MSTNVKIIGTRHIQVIKTGHVTTQSVEFDTIQTPTTVTHMICSSGSPIQSYIDHVLANSHDETIDTFADDDFLCETPIGKRVLNHGQEHVEELEEFLAMCDLEGFDVEVIAE